MQPNVPPAGAGNTASQRPQDAGSAPGTASGPEPAVPDFPPPQAPARHERSVPGLVLVAALVLALVGGTWLLGGFETASTRLIRLQPDTEVDLGPLSMSMQRATARKSYGDDWTVNVFARCRNNSDQPVSSVADRLVRNAFGAQHPISKEIADDASLFFGPSETLGEFDVINPGTPMIPCTLVFTFEDFPATDVLSVGASRVEWIDVSPSGEGQMAWSASRLGYRFELPVVMIPDRE